MITVTLEEFFEAVRHMRAAQIEYFAQRTVSKLTIAKSAEHAVDKMLEQGSKSIIVKLANTQLPLFQEPIDLEGHS